MCREYLEQLIGGNTPVNNVEKNLTNDTSGHNLFSEVVMAKCTVDGCENNILARCLCNKHYIRLRLTGTTGPGRRPRLPLEERFWRWVDKRGVNDCWEWTGNLKPGGYGSIGAGGVGGKTLLAHRVSYEMHKGKIPIGYVVMHSCDNKKCVNPQHLSVGTPKDNTWDMVVKGRHNGGRLSGLDNPKAVLNPDLVRYIRKSPLSIYKLANELGVGSSTIHSVRIGRTWSHVK